MSELVVVVFRDQYRAPEVLNELRRRNYCWLNQADEAAAVTLDEVGKAKVQLSVDLSNYKGTGWVRIWLSLLSTVLFSPVPEVMVGAVNGNAAGSNGRNGSSAAIRESSEARWWRESLELSDNFRRDVSALMGPDRSAIFMLLRNAKLPVALEQLRIYGDTIVHASVSSEQDEKMQALLSCA